MNTARLLTGWSAAGLLLLLPTVVLAWLAVLSTERVTDCLMYGEQCSPVPGELLYGLFWAALGIGVLALLWPRTRWMSARSGAVVVQWAAQLMLGMLILVGA